jgi:hypothetical protein
MATSRYIDMICEGLRWNNLTLGECDIAFRSDCDDEMFSASLFQYCLFSEQGTIATYARLGFDKQNQHSSAMGAQKINGRKN